MLSLFHGACHTVLKLCTGKSCFPSRDFCLSFASYVWETVFISLAFRVVRGVEGQECAPDAVDLKCCLFRVLTVGPLWDVGLRKRFLYFNFLYFNILSAD